MTNKPLQRSKDQTENTTLIASLLLDLCEKITDARRRNRSWKSHVNGALALVKLRRLDQFQDDSEISILVRLYTNHILSYIASDSPVPDVLDEIEAYIGKHVSFQDPRLRILNLVVQYADMRCEVRKGILSNDECIGLSTERDGQIQALDRELPLVNTRLQLLTRHRTEPSISTSTPTQTQGYATHGMFSEQLGFCSMNI